MGSFNRSVSKRWWRDFEYIPKHSKWLLESIQGASGTVTEMVKIVEEANDEEMNTPAGRAEKRLDLIEKVEEMCKAYYELAEQHDQLVGASHTHTVNSNKLSDQNSQQAYPLKAKKLTRLQSLKVDEIEEAVAPYNALAAQLCKVESELSMVKSELAKKEEMIFNSEKLIHEQKSNLSLQLKLELREKEVEEKRQEIERMKATLNEVEANKVSLDIRGSVLEEENKILKIQKVSCENRISSLMKDVHLSNERNKNLEKDYFKDKSRVELQEKELKERREEIDKMKLKLNEIETQKVSLDNRVTDLEEEIKSLYVQNVSYEEKIGNLLKEISLLNETKENIKKEVVLHLTDKENIRRDLSSKIEEINKVNAMQKEAIMKYETEKETFSQEKREEIDKMYLKLNEIETQKVSLDNRVTDLEEEIKSLYVQKVLYEEKIGNFLKEISLLNETKENIKKEVALNLTDKENIRRDLSSKIEDISKANAMQKEAIMKYEIEKDMFSQENALLENYLSKANFQKNKVCTQVALLEEEIRKLNQKLAEAEACNVEAEKAVCRLNKEIEILNEQKHSSTIIINKFIKKMLFWQETNMFLRNSHVWRNITEGGARRLTKGLEVIEKKSPQLYFWLYSFWGFLCLFLGPIKNHLGASIGSIRTILYFYGSFLAGHFSSKRVTDESDSDLSKSNNAPIENRDDANGKVEVNGARQLGKTSQLKMEVQENEVLRLDEQLCNGEEIKTNPLISRE